MNDKYLPLVNKIRHRKLFFFLSTLAAMIVIVVFVKNMLVTFLISFVIFFLLAPLVDYLERIGMSRLMATLIPFLSITVVVAAIMPIFIPMLADQFVSLRTDFPKYMEGINKLITDLQWKYRPMIHHLYKGNIAVEVQSRLTLIAQDVFKTLPEVVSNSLTILLLAPFLAFFMLLDGRQLIRNLLHLVPNNFFELVLNLNYQITTQMGGFIRARLLESIIVGLVIWVGLLIMNFPYALVLAIVGGLLNLIPYLGPIIGAAPAFLIAVINGVSPQEYLSLCIVYSAAQIVDIVVVVPFVVAKIVDLHPVTVVLSVIIGAEVMGILGMIVSIPLTSVLKVTFISLYRHLTEFRD